MAPFGAGDQPKLRTSQEPFGNAVGSIAGISLMFRSSMLRRVSVWQLAQSVLKKWLLAGAAITSRTSFILSAGGGGGMKRALVETPVRLAMGKLVGETAPFLQEIGLRLFVCGSGTTRGSVATGSSICANCWPSSVGPCTGMKPPFGEAAPAPVGTPNIDRNIQGAGVPPRIPRL